MRVFDKITFFGNNIYRAAKDYDQKITAAVIENIIALILL